MPRGNWSFVAALAGLAALLCAAGFGAYWGSLYGPDNKQYQTVGDGKGRSRSYEGITRSLPDAAGIPEPVERAIANPSPESGQDHEKRDLAAQEAMSVWGFWMMVAALGTFVITTFGTILIWRQVALTRRAVEDTGQATAAMVRQNELAEQAQRPWLEIDAVASNPKYSGDYFSFDLKIEIRNIGKTPATDVGILFHKDQFFSVANERDRETAFNRDIPDISQNRSILPNGNEFFLFGPSYKENEWVIPYFGEEFKVEPCITPLICVVAYYRWAGEEKFHRTGYWFSALCSIGSIGRSALPVRLIKENRLADFDFAVGKTGESMAT